MKLESTNLTVTANQTMDLATIKDKKNPENVVMLKHATLEELRDLLNDYFEHIN